MLLSYVAADGPRPQGFEWAVSIVILTLDLGPVHERFFHRNSNSMEAGFSATPL